MKIKRGTYQILRVDGSEEFIERKPNLGTIKREIGCDCIDTVTIDRKFETIMIVDDTGMIDGKPVNPKATELYWKVCRPGAWPIHGDVAICNDEDCRMTTTGVAKITGATPRMLQYWDEQGILCPDRNGHGRQYSAEQVVIVERAMALKTAGIKVRAIHLAKLTDIAPGRLRALALELRNIGIKMS